MAAKCLFSKHSCDDQMTEILKSAGAHEHAKLNVVVDYNMYKIGLDNLAKLIYFVLVEVL
jgi:hypothetical protein